MVDGQVTEHAALDLDFLGIHLPLHLVAGFKFALGHDACAGEHLL